MNQSFDVYFQIALRSLINVFLVTQLISPSGKLNDWPIFISFPLNYRTLLLRCLPLLHSAMWSKGSWAHDKLQRVNPHENQPCVITLETASDRTLDPLYTLVQRDQKRRLMFAEEFHFYGNLLMKQTIQTVTCTHPVAIRRTRMTLMPNGKVQKEILDFSVTFLSHWTNYSNIIKWSTNFLIFKKSVWIIIFITCNLCHPFGFTGLSQVTGILFELP